MGVQLRMAGNPNLLSSSPFFSFAIFFLVGTFVAISAAGNPHQSADSNDFLPSDETYFRPMKRGPYKYWQAFGSDGMAGLYDFVKRTPGQREVRSSYVSFGAPNDVQPSYDKYSSSWYRQPERILQQGTLQQRLLQKRRISRSSAILHQHST